MSLSSNLVQQNLDQWLVTATRCLAAGAAAQVRIEIGDHYQSTLSSGVSPSDALAALGDPKLANRRYRKVMLTVAEAKHLRSIVGETRYVSKRPSLRTTFIVTPILLLCSASAASYADQTRVAQVLLALGLALGLVLAAPFLPIYTVSRSRVYRAAKWIALATALVLVSGPAWWWLSMSAFYYPLYTELVSMSIRRKLPATHWPKALYL